MLTIVNRKFRLGRLFALATCILMLATLAVVATKLLHREVDAVTQGGATVKIVREDPALHYGSTHKPTHRYFVYSPVDAQSYFLAYCANPDLDSPTDTDGREFEAVELGLRAQPSNYDKIKFIIYVSTIDDDNHINDDIMDDLFTPEIMDALFPVALYEDYANMTIQDKRYALTHAMIGYFYEGCTSGVCQNGELMPELSGVEQKIKDYIEDDDESWVIAKNYKLFGIAESSIPAGAQNIVWIEDAATFGHIKVIKCDNSDETTCHGAQGDASLGGITFDVYNNSGESIYYNGHVYTTYDNSAQDNTNARVATGRTNQNGIVEFRNLPTGSYLVKERATNDSYNLTATQSQTVVVNSGTTSEIKFYNDIIKGGIRIVGCDAEVEECTSLGGANLAGATFEIYNNSANAIIYDNQTIEHGGLVASVTIEEPNCDVTFPNLPYGEYRIVQTGAGEGYIINSEEQIIEIHGAGTVDVSFCNQVVRGDVKFTKKDKNTGEAMANIPFRITSKTTGESHIVVTNRSGVVNTSASVIPHTNHPNGYDNMYGSIAEGISYRGYGTWFSGLSPEDEAPDPDDSLGALPYDKYVIEELACDGNEFCSGVGVKQEFEIKRDGVVVELGANGIWENDCDEFSLETVATDNADGDKEVIADEDAEIKDAITYCLSSGKKFIIMGVLYDKETEEPIMINDEPVTSVIEVEVGEEACGEAEMIYSFDATGLGGTDIVVFTYVLYGDDNEIVLAHADIDDEDQTIQLVAPKTPDTGVFSRWFSDGQGVGGEVWVGTTIVIVTAGLYATSRLTSRKKFLGHIK